MDFKTQPAPKDGLCGVAADALLLVVAGETLPTDIDASLGQALASAIEAGDFKLKAGQALYLHRVAGVKAARVAVAACGEASAASWRKALAAGLNLLKGGGARQVAVAAAGLQLTDAHAEALALVAREVTYVYRHTKPSAPPPSALAKVTLVAPKDLSAALDAGLRRGAAIAAGVTLARECANRPANHCTPSYLAAQAKALAKSHGLKVEVLERKDCEKLGMGAFLAVAQASTEPPKFIVMRWTTVPPRPRRRWCWWARASPSTPAASRSSPAPDGRDEVRHGRRRQRAGHAARRRRAEAQAQPGRHHRRVREHARRQRREAGRRGHQPVGPDHRDPEHRRRGPPDPV
jgi:hypothetical protein